MLIQGWIKQYLGTNKFQANCQYREQLRILQNKTIKKNISIERYSIETEHYLLLLNVYDGVDLRIGTSAGRAQVYQ